VNIFASLIFLVLGSLTAIFLGAWGVELIEENPFGWVLLATGAGYPPGAILYLRRRREKFKQPR
jgi:hypothetical protein